MATVNVKRPPIESVTLELTEREAVAVAAAVGATPAGGLYQRIYSVLREAGLGYDHPLYAEFQEGAR